MLKLIAKLLKVLNSEADPSQISLAFAFSMIAGLTPLFSLHNLPVFLLVLILRVNLSAFILGFFLFSGLGYLLDPLFHLIGLKVLTAGSLEGLWTALYNSPLWRIERFNNSIVMGSLFFCILFFIPLHLLVKSMVIRYRQSVFEWVLKTKVMQILKGSRFYHIYQSIG